VGLKNKACDWGIDLQRDRLRPGIIQNPPEAPGPGSHHAPLRPGIRYADAVLAKTLVIRDVAHMTGKVL
jgi:hypothetical protein